VFTAEGAGVAESAGAIRFERRRRPAEKFGIGIGPLALAAPDSVVTDGESIGSPAPH